MTIVFIWEIVKNIRKSRLITVLLILLLTLILFFFGHIGYSFNIDTMSLEIKSNESYIEYSNFVFSPIDMTDPPIMRGDDEPYIGRNFNDREDLYELIYNLQKMVNDLEEEGFLHLSMTSSGVRLLREELQYKEILSQYYTRASMFGQSVFEYEDHPMKNNDYMSVKAIHVDIGFFKNENLHYAKGSGLDENDFNYTVEEPLPVVLGYDFIDIYNIGDIIEPENYNVYKDKIKNEGFIDYFALGAKYIVVGFFEKDTIIMDVGMSINSLNNLNNYIIIPKIIPKNIEDVELDSRGIFVQEIYYTTVIFARYLYNREKTEEGEAKMTAIIKKYGLDEHYYVRNADFGVALTESLAQKRIESYSLMSLFVLIFSFTGITITLISKYKKKFCRLFGIYAAWKHKNVNNAFRCYGNVGIHNNCKYNAPHTACSVSAAYDS